MKERKSDLNVPLNDEINLVTPLNTPNDLNIEEENKLTPYYTSNIFGKFFLTGQDMP